MRCPHCLQTTGQVKAGHNVSGTQRYQCQGSQKNYTPEALPHGYSDELRHQAVRMYVDGVNLRRVGRQLGVNHQSVANWVKAYAHRSPPAPIPAQVETAKLDELYTFIRHKKKRNLHHNLH